MLAFLTVNGEIKSFRSVNKVPRRFEKDEYLSLMKKIIALVASMDKMKQQKGNGEEPKNDMVIYKEARKKVMYKFNPKKLSILPTTAKPFKDTVLL